MLFNYFKIAWRSLWKNKLFSVINILGLGIAIPFALLSLLQLQASFEFDNFHPDPDRIFRIITDAQEKGGSTAHYASSPWLLADDLEDKYACVEEATRVVRDFGWELGNGIKNLKVNTLFVEPAFFEVFGFALGSGTLPLAPNELAITPECALKFFGDANPIGQTLSHPTYGDFRITGLLNPFKKQTQFRSDVMVSMATYTGRHPESAQPASWGMYEAHTFVKIHKNAAPEALDLAIGESARQSNLLIASTGMSNAFRKQALADISPSREDMRNNPYVESLTDIYINFSIPLMILILAGFNYTNLTLARSLTRTKEVGVRKVMGARRPQLILQFICEAVVIALFALLLGMGILQLMRTFIHVSWVTWEVENTTMIALFFVAFALFTGFMAGILPAWILSGFQPAKVMKGALAPAGLGRSGLRKTLIVIQFAVALGFIFANSHLYNQFEYMATENDNFNRRNIVNITLAGEKYGPLLDEIARNGNIERIGLCSSTFGSLAAEYALKADPAAENMLAWYYAADRNFIENMNLKILAGQNLPPQAAADSAGHFVLLNEEALRRLNLGTAQDAIGKTVFLNNAEVLVAGVVQDFCHFNYQFRKEPLVLRSDPAQYRVMSVKTADGISQDGLMAELNTTWKKHHPYREMVAVWYDREMYERYYPAEDMKMMGVASVVIVVIALMGLLGMIVYSVERRVREIGIRKVLGASIAEVMRILSWSFAKLLLLAGLIALPFGFFFGWMLLNLFTFHSALNVGLMLGLFAGVMFIALLSIAYFTGQAALANPVKSLRSE